MDAQALGARVRTLRRQAGLSATELAGVALSVATVSRIESGQIEPSLATLRALAARLNRPVADLFLEDDGSAALQRALDEAEAYLWLELPIRALERCQAALAKEAPRQPTREWRETHDQARWAACRARAALDPLEAPTLDGALREARAAGDVWAAAQLAIARAPTLDADRMLITAQHALAALTPLERDTIETVAIRATILFWLAGGNEGLGAEETARALYAEVTTACAPFAQPENAARLLLDDSTTARSSPARPSAEKPGSTNLPTRRSPTQRGGSVQTAAGRPDAGEMEQRRQPERARLLAVVAAGARLWRQATLAQARLDLRARRLGQAAQRLRATSTPVSVGDTALLGSFWAELERTIDERRTVPPAEERMMSAPEDQGAGRSEALLRVELAIRAGRPQEAEQVGALTAAALASSAPRDAQHLWQKLALAWAEAGNAPRAARALRAALALDV